MYRVARPNRSTHLVAVATIAVVVAAVYVAGCLGLDATKRKKPAHVVQKQLCQKNSVFSFSLLYFPLSEPALNLISGDSSQNNIFLLFLILFFEGVFGETMGHLLILF